VADNESKKASTGSGPTMASTTGVRSDDLTGPFRTGTPRAARAGAYSRLHAQVDAPVTPAPQSSPAPSAPTLAPVDAGDLVGQTVAGRYRVLKKLGEGGMGTVYLSEHVTIEKKVALKVLLHDYARKQDLKERFLQEAKAAAKIGHENIVDITDFGDTPDGSVFFAMEYLEGVDLSQLIHRQGPVSWSRAKPILLQICRALGAAHAKGIIHRDMKPENIYLIEREGRADFVKVLDFGIAKMSMENGESRLTRTGMIFGTPEYMSPEQAQGNKPDHRVDIYAVGVIMYEMLTGHVPFKADTFMGILTKHIFEQPVPPSMANPEMAIPNEAETIALKALSKERDERFQSMAEMAAAIGQASGRMTRPTGGDHPIPPRILAASPSTALPMVATPAPSATEIPDVLPTGRGKMVAVVIICALIIGAAVGVGLVLRKDKGRAGVDPGAKEPGAEVDPKAKVERGTKVVGTRPDAVSVKAARHKITIVTDPAGAEILLGGKPLGRSPAPVELDHGTADVTLTLRLAGHKSRDIQLTPDQDQRQVVPLEPLPTGAPTVKGRPKTTIKGKKIEPTKAEPAKVEPAKVEPKKVEPKKVEPAKVEPKTKKPELKKNPTTEDLIDPFKK
jgi:eukaryotic-like serine/threonine-protein kinase